jgi:hypothetical protein
MRPKVPEQERKVPRSISFPLRVDDRLVEQAEKANKTVSAYLTDLLKQKFGMS